MDVTEQTRAIHKQWWDCMSAGDTDGMYRLVADDYRSWSPRRGWIGKAETMKFAQWFRTLLVDGWFHFDDPIITVEGERACTATASHAKLKNGNIYNNHYHFLHVIRNGKIVEAREYNDSLHVWQVLGNELADLQNKSK